MNSRIFFLSFFLFAQLIPNWFIVLVVNLVRLNSCSGYLKYKWQFLMWMRVHSWIWLINFSNISLVSYKFKLYKFKFFIYLFTYLIILYFFSNKRHAFIIKNVTIKIWDPNTGLLKFTLLRHINSIYKLIVLPNGNLASGYFDFTIKIWY